MRRSLAHAFAQRLCRLGVAATTWRNQTTSLQLPNGPIAIANAGFCSLSLAKYMVMGTWLAGDRVTAYGGNPAPWGGAEESRAQAAVSVVWAIQGK